MKRYLYTLGIIALVGAVIFLGYFFRYRAGTAPDGANDTGSGAEEEGSGLPQTAPLAAQGGGQFGAGSGASGEQAGSGLSKTEGALQAVSAREAQSFSVTKEGVVEIIQPDGEIVRIASGKEEVVGAAQIISLIGSSFSADGKKAAATFLSGAARQSSVFDTESKTWLPLPQNARAIAWSPLGQTIAYLRGAAGGGQEIVSQDLQNEKAKPRVLASIAMEDISLSWPSPDKMVIAPRESARVAGTSLMFDLKKKTFAVVGEDERGLTSVWNASGTKGLVFAAGKTARGGNLSIRDAGGNVLSRLSFLTLPSKCVFAAEAPRAAAQASSTASSTETAAKREPAEMLYCGIPRGAGVLSSAEIPDSYEKHALYTEDDIYRIDLKDGLIEFLWSGAALSVDVDAPRVANGKFYFINRYDKKLYALSLPHN